jgi:hypothetical protein
MLTHNTGTSSCGTLLKSRQSKLTFEKTRPEANLAQNRELKELAKQPSTAGELTPPELRHTAALIPLFAPADAAGKLTWTTVLYV